MTAINEPKWDHILTNYCHIMEKGSTVKMCTVISYPIECLPVDLKAIEAESAVENIVEEMDYGVHCTALKLQDNQKVLKEVLLICGAAAGR